MSLKETLDQKIAEAGMCRFGKIRALLSAEEKVAVRKAMEAGVQYKEIASALKDEGYTISADSVRRCALAEQCCRHGKED